MFHYCIVNHNKSYRLQLGRSVLVHNYVISSATLHICIYMESTKIHFDFLLTIKAHIYFYNRAVRFSNFKSVYITKNNHLDLYTLPS